MPDNQAQMSAWTIPPEIVGLAAAILRIFLMAFFTALVTRGWLRDGDTTTLAEVVEPVILPAIGFVTIAAWSLFNRTKARMVKLVANMRGVSTVHVAPELAAKIADPSVLATPPAGR